MSKLILFLTVFLSVVLKASEGGHEGHEEGVPVIVLYQTINVAIIFAAAFWFGRHKVVSFFVEKQKAFLDAQNKAKLALEQAEHEHHAVKTRLDKLQSNKVDTISKAKADAHDMQKQIISDAEAMALKLKADAELAAKIEFQRAKNDLRNQLVKEAFELSRKNIVSTATKEDQKRLQKEFINKVQVAQ